MRRALATNSIFAVLTAAIFFAAIAALSFAFTVGNSVDNNYIVDYDITGLATGDPINSTSYNVSLSGTILGDSLINSTNKTSGVNYNITYGILAGATEITVTTSTTTTAPGGSSGIVSYSASTDDRVSGITVDPGTNVSIKAIQNASISLINFISNRTISNAGINVKKIEPAKALQTAAAPTQKVFEYIEITKTNIADDALRTVKIKFLVTKAWMAENKVSESQVALQRLESSGWRKLPTKKISEDATNINFESDSPGLSIYAITVLPEGETPPSTIPEVTPATSTTSPPATISKVTTTTPEGKATDSTGLIAAVVLILIVIAAVFLKKK